MSQTMREIISNAKEELLDAILTEELNEEEANDRMFEIADSYVPVYHSDLMALGESNMELMLAEPEIGPAYDGSTTAINVLAAVVYENIQQALAEFYSTFSTEYEVALEEYEQAVENFRENYSDLNHAAQKRRAKLLFDEAEAASVDNIGKFEQKVTDHFENKVNAFLNGWEVE